MSKIIVCNQKMLLSYDESKLLRDELDDYNNDELIVCPNFLNMKLYKDFNIGAQNCHYEDNGAFTGEVSPYHLSLIGIKYVLVGHSERRDVDTDEIINKKIISILKHKMTPILCIGETRLDSEMHRTSEVLKKQLTVALNKVIFDSDDEIMIAYEPRWVIGSKKTLTKELIEDTYSYIKKILDKLNIKNYKILYGGSIHSDNIKEIKSNKLDGYLLGNASCDINEIKAIIKCIKA